ncbi:hypothetical protein H2248_003995 [Termitomyces sp. 'cryptogamus']|nr:hypothetical protein H2248_003995 [Termitomyces sp. 'cryptogamus']
MSCAPTTPAAPKTAACAAVPDRAAVHILRIKHEQADNKLTILVRPRPPAVLPNPVEPWKHPDELEYIRPHSWFDSTLIAHLLDNAFDVPPRHPPRSSDPWCVVTNRNGSTTIVPKGYRLPLMFAMKFQWESLRLVLTSQQREEEWKDYKFDFLHVSRLCASFLKEAQEAMASNGMDKMWRSPMFDRALTRYYRRWLVNREEFLMWFWKEFEEEEYAGDVLKKGFLRSIIFYRQLILLRSIDWTRFVLKGHKGFHLTKEECAQGLSYKTLTTGLEQRSDGRFYWNLPPAPPADPENDKEKQTKKVTGKRKRGADGDNEKEKEKDKGKGKDKEGKGEAKKEKDKEVVKKEKEKEVVKKEKEKEVVKKGKGKGKGKKEVVKKKEKEKVVAKEKRRRRRRR